MQAKLKKRKHVEPSKEDLAKQEILRVRRQNLLIEQQAIDEVKAEEKQKK